MENDGTHVAINSNADIVEARQKGRALAIELGFDGSDLTLIAAAISEIARNIVDHAKTGEIILNSATQSGKRGICIIAKDQGPGIKDVAKAMQYGGCIEMTNCKCRITIRGFIRHLKFVIRNSK
jgi:serine/threonine-protein kinase RsbT